MSPVIFSDERVANRAMPSKAADSRSALVRNGLVVLGAMFIFALKNKSDDLIRHSIYMGMTFVASYFIFDLTVETFNLPILTALFSVQLVSLLAIACARNA